MKGNFRPCFDLTLKYEGGFGNDPHDRGNWSSGKIGVGKLIGTKYGIDAADNPGVDIPNLTVDGAAAIYELKYWPAVAGDEQPVGVDLVVYDIGLNSGPARGLAIQGKALGTTARGALALAGLAQAAPDKVALIKAMCAARESFYRGISTFARYGKGWLARNADVEARAVKMVLGASGVPPAEVKKRLEKEASGAAKAGKTQAGAAAGSATGTAAPTQTPPHDMIDWLTLGEIGLVALALLGVAYFGWRYLHNNARAKAYAAAANPSEA